MKITLIAALAHNRVIGINNTLPWKLSADLKRFKALTTNHTLLMGRKTFESLGRPLPGRIHVCVSRGYSTQQLTADERWPEQVFWCGDLFAAIQILKDKKLPSASDVLYIIGGADIYNQSLAIADTLELTHIDAEFEGDAFFPAYENLFTREEEASGEDSGLRYSFARYRSLRPGHFVVRPARPSDAEFIARSQVKMALETENLRLNEDTVQNGTDEVFRDPRKGEYLIAEQAAENGTMSPVGCLLLQKEWSDWRNGYVEWMHSVYVEPSVRRQGLFRWMHAVAVARAQTRGSRGMRLYVDKSNQVAQKTYAHLGMSHEHYELFEKLFQ